MALWSELRNDFAALGFDVRFVDEQKVTIHGHPGDAGKNPAALFRKMLDDFQYTETDMFENRREQLAALLAQESAIKYNQSLTAEEINHLIEQLFTCAMPNYSPAGKPIMRILDMDVIEGYF